MTPSQGCNIAAAHWQGDDTRCCHAAIHLKKKRCHAFLGRLASQEEHVVLDMLKIVGGHGQEGSNHRRVGFGHAFQTLAFNKANGGVDDGFGGETMEVAILEAEEIAPQGKRAYLAATVR